MSRVARSLPAAAVLVLAGLALVSLASSSRPTELETIADGEGSLPSTTADATETSEAPPSSVPASPDEAGPTSSDQGETSPSASTPTSTSDDLQADAGADTSTGSATTDGSATTSPPTDADTDTTATTESGQGSEASGDSGVPTTDTSTDAGDPGQPDSNDGQPGDADANDDADGGTDGGAADGDDPDAQAPADDADQREQGSEQGSEEGDAALAEAETPEEDEQSFVQNALAVFIAIIAVLGLLSLLVPPLWSLIQRWRDRDKDESLRRILWQWFRGLWSNGDEEVADSIKPAPLLNPIVMLDRLRTELESEPDPRSAVRKAYAAVESGFGDDEKARHTGETPTAYLERALGSLVEGENRPLAQLTYLFLLARYSQHDITEAMRNEAIDAVVELRSRYRQTEAVLV